MADETARVSFKDTLNLPHTDFPIRPQAAVDDPQLVTWWNEKGIIADAMALHAGKPLFVLHDGPPYANGTIHLGHAYNKILKDVITKSRRMMGYHVPVIPGWDCHGLPIEQKVSQEVGAVDPVALKKACREYAGYWVTVQSEAFQRLGVFMDWNNPYLTMTPSYEGATVRAFGALVKTGSITRSVKTVPWCPTCKTALASAEIEYQDRKDPSVYVRFVITPEDAAQKLGSAEEIAFLVWTTTPWTLPLNRAVVLRPGARYALVRAKGKLILIGEKLISTLEQMREEHDAEVEVLRYFDAEHLVGLRVKHPIEEGRTVPVIADISVGVDEGTACVHNAPGCGPIDYEVAVKHGLEIYSPISADGSYTADICLPELVGMPVAKGQTWMITLLLSRGTLFYKTSLRHSYPHCWRSRDGLIFRATPQWFFNLNHDHVKQRALDALTGITFTPEQGRRFLHATIENRWEWCLSRQRQWGVPIVALLHNDGITYYAEPEFIEQVGRQIEEHGIEWWDTITIEAMQQQGILPQDRSFAEYRKERDILDVWFDSGVSHYAVLRERAQHPGDAAFPADLYLEGIDQHRGWFQSSLLTSMVLNKQAPMRGIMTHGFTVDEKGQKMSKSLGNVIAPQEIIEQLGTDGLRLWVASIGYDGDAVVSKTLLSNVAEVYRKIRNTCRFLLQNIHQYDHARDAVAFDNLLPFDRYALAKVYLFNARMIAAYRSYNLTAIFHGLAEYCTRDLSALYLDVVKDRLYCGAKDGRERRSAQTVIWHILDTLTRLMAPLLSFTSELVTRSYLPSRTSVHLEGFAQLSDMDAWWGVATHTPGDILDEQWIHTRMTADQVANALGTRTMRAWEEVLAVREAIVKHLEPLRAQGTIRHSLEAGVMVYFDDMTWVAQVETLLGVRITDLLKEVCIISECTAAATAQGLQEVAEVPGLYLEAHRAPGVKCPRCWQWSRSTDPDDLCERCARVVRG